MGLLPVAMVEGVGFLILNCCWLRRPGRNTEDQAAGACAVISQCKRALRREEIWMVTTQAV